jgi:hypothetical protein
MNLPQVFSPAEVQKTVQDFFDPTKGYLHQAETGQITPEQYIFNVTANAAQLAQGGHSQQSMLTDPNVLSGLGKATIALINQKEAMGQMDKAKADEARAAINAGMAESVVALNKAKTQYVGVEATTLPYKLQAELDLAKAKLATSQAYATDISTRAQTAANGTWYQRKEILDKEGSNITTALKDAGDVYSKLKNSQTQAIENGDGSTKELDDAVYDAYMNYTTLQKAYNQLKQGGNSDDPGGVRAGLSQNGIKTEGTLGLVQFSQGKPVSVAGQRVLSVSKQDPNFVTVENPSGGKPLRYYIKDPQLPILDNRPN